MKSFPIDAIKEALFSALKNGSKSFVINAPTGSGKSTRLPLMFADKVPERILVLQPRRVAARLLAKFVAESLGTKVGDLVGWHIRSDKNYTQNTKIVFVTEGILTRMILNDSSLRGISAIIFDEFHERNIFSDISLGLALKQTRALRPDLILSVCSASMNSGELQNFLGDGVVRLDCESRLFDIGIEYAPLRGQSERVWDRALIEFERLAKENETGDFLIFMPGAYEISRTISALLKSPYTRGCDVLPLHGNLSAAMQDRAVAPSEKRKIVVATNIAETSLTIDGVKFVIDSGLARVARYDIARGVDTLLTERVSLASATQRAGRAGRTSNGIAVRLWRQSDEVNFEKFTVPEILRLDISQMLLWLKSAGLNMCDIPLLDYPSEASLLRSEKILTELGAINKEGKITKAGADMARFPSEPRHARVLMEAASRNCLELVAVWMAICDVGRIKTEIANERLEFERLNMLEKPTSEFDELSQLIFIAKENRFDEKFCRDFGIHGANARRVLEIASEYFHLAKAWIPENSSAKKNSFDSAAKALLSAFSDHLCVRLNEGTLACAIVDGRRGEVRRESKAYASKIFAALDLNEQNLGGRASIMASLICPIEKNYLREIFPDDFKESTQTLYDERQKRIVSSTRTLFRDLVLEENSSDKIDAEASAKIFADLIMQKKLTLKNWGEAEEDFIERVNFVAEICPESGISQIDEGAKQIIFEQLCAGAASYSDIKNAEPMKFLKDWLSFEQLAMLDYLAPQYAEISARKRPVKIRYDKALKRAYVPSKFSDFYDFDQRKIKIADGKILPTFEILAPNGRPVQLTQNLDEFWKTSWPSIMKELKARYPKHFKTPTEKKL